MKFKKNYIQLTEGRFGYKKENNSNHFLDTLATLFNDHGNDAEWFLKELLDSKSTGISGSLICIEIRGNKVFLEPSFIMKGGTLGDDPIEMDRNELIRIANEWQELVERNAPQIFIVHQDGRYFVMDALPEGVE